jgi:hypothetical protein
MQNKDIIGRNNSTNQKSNISEEAGNLNFNLFNYKKRRKEIESYGIFEGENKTAIYQ